MAIILLVGALFGFSVLYEAGGLLLVVTVLVVLGWAISIEQTNRVN